MHRHEIEVSLFVDPVVEQIDAAKEVGADRIELHTGEYANARSPSAQLELLGVLRSSAQQARGLGLGVNAGHGLNYMNIVPFRTIEEIEEVSIGHAVISRAVFTGLEGAVRAMLALVR
jgi:pyridoxine 5-phosphate synthase